MFGFLLNLNSLFDEFSGNKTIEHMKHLECCIKTLDEIL